MFKKYPVVRLILCVVLLFLASSSLQAQTEQEIAQAAERAAQLFSQQRFAEAVPDFEIVSKAMPDDPKVRFLYGFCLVAKSKQVSNTDEAKQLSAKALDQFKEAKRLGMSDPMNDTLIAMLSGAPPPSGPDAAAYSANPQADKAMVDAESLFAQSKYDEAIKLFEKALSLDPKLYQQRSRAAIVLSLRTIGKRRRNGISELSRSIPTAKPPTGIPARRS
jgi:tetratricopeptide (TPR) repeat protein